VSGRTVGQALAAARTVGVDRLDAQLLLGHALGRPRAWLLAHGDDVVPADAAARFDAGLARRAAGEPVAYLLGTREFRGLDFAVDARVLVPRPDTEVLVAWALDCIDAWPSRPVRVADLGTGSGAIAVSLAHARPEAVLTAVDVDPGALAVAAANAARHGAAVRFQSGSWWGALGGERFDVVVSNPPYIAAGDAHLPALRYEPARALVSGEDGLDALREIVAGAPGHLEPGGWLLLEHGHDQSPAVADLLRASGFSKVSARSDLAGHWRCTGGCRAR
jgi:release factor glutamine methyltransferase